MIRNNTAFHNKVITESNSSRNAFYGELQRTVILKPQQSISNRTFSDNNQGESITDNTWENSKIRVPSTVDEEILFESADYFNEKRTTSIQEITHGLLNTLRIFAYDDESMGPSWDYLYQCVSMYPKDYICEAFQYIYVQNNSEINCQCGLCRCLIEFDFDEVFPWGQTILAGLLNHKSELIKEYAVSLLDNWKRIELVDLLKNLDVKTPWLREYINSVVTSIEEN